MDAKDADWVKEKHFDYFNCFGSALVCARMRKVRLLVLPGALLVKVSLSLGIRSGERTFGRKKRYSSEIKEEVSKHSQKGWPLFHVTFFFEYHHTRREEEEEEEEEEELECFFSGWGGFFMINMSFGWVGGWVAGWLAGWL